MPDQVFVEPTGTPHTPLADEDEDFVQVVWSRAAKGATPPDCEASIPTDGYRIRRLLAMADKRAEELGIPDTEASLTPEMLEEG